MADKKNSSPATFPMQKPDEHPKRNARCFWAFGLYLRATFCRPARQLWNVSVTATPPASTVASADETDRDLAWTQ